MLPCNVITWTRGKILLAMISILCVLDATAESTTVLPQTTQSPVVVSVKDAVSTQSLAGKNSSVLPEQGSDLNQTDATSMLTGPPAHDLTGTTSSSLIETIEPDNKNATQSPVPEAIFTTLSPHMGNSSQPGLQRSESPTFTKPETTTQTVQITDNATTPQSTSLGTNVLSAQTTAVPGNIICLGLGSIPSNSQVACFQYEEKPTCENLDKEKKEELRSFLCEILNTTQCNITIHSSEVKPTCILWVPTSKDAKDRIKNEEHIANSQLHTQIMWGQISDHQTRSQKTMIALVTCGVLLAAFILAGYFLSNRESWSPGRQRLGEDPYCAETDSQGNTLVSVSAHAQDKPNNGTRENGTGQTVLPAATNGHSTKKQTSDTEL
ncbi:hematopoietic progenitor cell antigen CD34 [Hyla sarda]|uniref:hematopoietic progenitor cell antigen CD34 n=1 Tax=Hyla sarda TaxID=327740 RepID=UPI0024C3925F|nr:hematopoietic progenitor cell antigen CD34 [Hyla sarda]